MPLKSLGSMGGDEIMGSQGYCRTYYPFSTADTLRTKIGAKGNQNGPRGFQELGEEYSFTPWWWDSRNFGSRDTGQQGGGFFLTVNTFKQPHEIAMNSFAYALSHCKPLLTGEAARQWDTLKDSANASNIEAIVAQFFAPVMDRPKEGDLVLYRTTKAVRTDSGLPIGANQVVHAGVFRNSQRNWNSPRGGTVESKWSFIKNPHVFQHDFFFCPDYFGDEITLFRPHATFDPQTLTHIFQPTHHPKTKTQKSATGPLSGTTALILTAEYDADGVMDSSRGFYKRGLLQLRKAGCDIDAGHVGSREAIMARIAATTDSSVSFAWIHAHGLPKLQKYASDYLLTADAVADVFQGLPAKLTDTSVVFLDSCHTGSTKNDFYNNVQFAFGKLTAHMPNVKIIAPSRELFLSSVSWTSQGLDIEATASPRTMWEDITMTLDGYTKEILKEAQKDNRELSSVAPQLLQSLKKRQYGGTLYNLFTWIEDSGHRIEPGLRIAALNKQLDKVRYFVEKLGADVNPLKELFEPCEAHWHSPLYAAINGGSGEIITYLLNHGANPADSWQGYTPATYAEKKGKYEIAQLLFQAK